MFNPLEKIRKKAFEQGYKIGYKVATEDYKQEVFATRIDSYNEGFCDGVRSKTCEALVNITKGKTKKKGARKCR